MSTVAPVVTRLSIQERWDNDIPLKFLWTVFIIPRAGSYDRLGANITRTLNKYESSNRDDWPVKPEAFKSQTDSRGNFGYMFAKSVALPQDSFQIATAQTGYKGGHIDAYYANGRNAYGSQNKIDISFMETNTDVIDYFIRPWIIANSHLGLIERDNRDFDLKCNIMLCLYSRSDKPGVLGRGLKLRKRFDFYDAAPFIVQGGEMNYSSEMSLDNISKTVGFVFSRYVIKKFNLGGFESNFDAQSSADLAINLNRSPSTFASA